MNLEVIKRSGLLLGLEAELSTQERSLKNNINDHKWEHARQCSGNISLLLDELIKLYAKPEVKSPSIDDLDERIERASTDK